MPECERWRYACPEGHRDLSRRRWPDQHTSGDGPPWYCNTCRQGYAEAEVTDLA